MADYTKWYVFGRRGLTRTVAIAEKLHRALERYGIDRSEAYFEAWPLDDDAAGLGAKPSRLIESTGSLLPVNRPDTLFTARIPTWLEAPAAMADAWPGCAAYPVEEAVIIDGPSSGICRVVVVTRKPGMTRAEFSQHWRDQHAPLVLQHGPLFHRYVQNNVRHDESAIDGIAEQWFADRSRVDEHDRLNAQEKPEVVCDLRRFIHSSQQLLTPLLSRVEDSVSDRQ